MLTQILVFGRRKQGKSTLTIKLACSHHERVLIFDPNAQFNGIGHQAGTVEQVHHAILNGEHAIIVFSPEDDPVAGFNHWAELLWTQWKTLPMSVVIDECSLLQSASGANKKLERLIRQSPESTTVLQSTHRISDTVMVARQLMTDVYFFFTQNRIDLERIEKDFDEVGPEIALAVSRLESHQVVHIWLEPGGFIRWTIWEPDYFYVRIGTEEQAAA